MISFQFGWEEEGRKKEREGDRIDRGREGIWRGRGRGREEDGSPAMRTRKGKERKGKECRGEEKRGEESEYLEVCCGKVRKVR